MVENDSEIDGPEILQEKVAYAIKQTKGRKATGSDEIPSGLDVNQDIYGCFIDFEKAFDKVRYEKLIDILKSKNIDSRDIRIISNSYWNRNIKIQVEEELSKGRNTRGMSGVLPPLPFNIYSETILQEYLNTQLTEDAQQTKEIRIRIEIARAAFIKLKKIQSSRDIKVELRAEAWTPKQADIEKLQSFELCCRRILQISWADHVSNVEVLNRLSKEEEINTNPEIKEIGIFQNVMRRRRYSLLKLITEVAVYWKRERIPLELNRLIFYIDHSKSLYEKETSSYPSYMKNLVFIVLEPEP
ncbi:hypothetical protein ILUMI_27286 [Ignelater luminosus]|uniref:Reverse transcriptase domain-containing protein n=1 Tax=Ignelater luminosus TaxID=2038154 RepID=A0A8K0C389_IGNLU|nr:hypothetical protein ILUMI_27286 [Ignelater luminosus]